MNATKLFLLALAAAVVTNGAPLRAQTCDGDCDGDGSVAVQELILEVRIALGTAATAECLAADDDGDGAVTVNELLAAVRRALDGCGVAATPTETATAIATPTPTQTPLPTTVDQAALAAAGRVATEPIFRLFDLQETLIAAVVVAGRARRTAQDEPIGGPGCQELDCQLAGTQVVCCSGTEFTQTFDNCTFDDLGGPGRLSGQLAISSTTASLCSGAIPTDASFVLTLDSFTHDIAMGDGGFFRSVHQYSERYEMAPADCTVSHPDVVGFGIRGSGRRLLNGFMRRFETDGSGALRTDIESVADMLAITVGATQEGEECEGAAALTGAVSGADFRAGTQATIDFTDFKVVQDPQADGTVLLQLNGTVGTDCLGDVTVSTAAPLRARRGGRCFTAGRLDAQLAESTASSTYGDGGALDLDLDGDGNPDQHFAACTDVPMDQCGTDAVVLCGSCTTADQCQPGLGCFPCSDECAGGPQRCAFSDTFVTCEDGVF